MIEVEFESQLTGRVLVVDDSEDNLRLVEAFLHKTELEIRSAASGEQALRIAPSFQPDLILLDVLMPGIDGYEACFQFKHTESTAEIPIIFMTALRDQDEIIKGFNLGAVDYITKPFKREELIARVKTHLILQKTRQELRERNELLARMNQEKDRTLLWLERELELARRTQQLLIPEKTPQAEGFQVAARYRAMQKVGGDFYDFVLNDDYLAFFIADVSGHGVSSALIVSMVRMAFDVQDTDIPDPAGHLKQMNAILNGKVGSEFTTASFAYINRRTRELKIANAGHPPLLLWKAREQTIMEIRPHGRLLGILNDIGVESESVPLDSGDRVLLFTDGVIEGRSPAGREMGEAEFHRIIREQHKLTAEDFCDYMIEHITRWCGGGDHISDDIALIVVDVL